MLSNYNYWNYMDTSYKNFSFLASAELDSASNKWNGRYRIINEEGIVVLESFVDPMDNETQAQSNAETAAKSWIDEQ